jgi:hypothetical protein
MTACATEQRAIDQSSDEDLTSEGLERARADAVDDFETGSIDLELEVDVTATRRGRGGSIQRRQRGGSFHGSNIRLID